MIIRFLKYMDYAYRLIVVGALMLPITIVSHLARLVYSRKGMRLWLIGERPDEARDNGFHLYRYIRQNRPDINIIYVISREGADFRKIEALGPWVPYGSLRHYFLYAVCDVALSTHVHGVAPQHIGRLAGGLILSILPKKLTVVLRHGIAKDHYTTFNRILESRSKMMMICGARREYEYFSAHAGPNCKVVHTGFARFDALATPVPVKRQILLMPTFRKWIADLSRLPLDKALSRFCMEEYYVKLNELINSEDLNRVLEENKIDLIFYPHYQVHRFLHVFKPHGARVKVAHRKEYDVQALLKESALLITDFSSVFFDFAYLRKPVIYYQFDTERYRRYHYKEGYFSYEKDGFGPVVHDLETLLSKIVDYIQSDFVVPQVYRERIEKFFGSQDTENCRRIVEVVEAALTPEYWKPIPQSKPVSRSLL